MYEHAFDGKGQSEEHPSESCMPPFCPEICQRMCAERIVEERGPSAWIHSKDSDGDKGEGVDR